MIKVLLTGRNLGSLSAFKAALDSSGAQTKYLVSGGAALAAVEAQSFDVLIADEDLGDMTGLALIRSVVAVQPMLNCAVVSALAPAEFHEVSEGLGILMQLPVQPGPKEADRLIDHLRKIMAF
jgi:DNA-binding NtrC family response regulator